MSLSPPDLFLSLSLFFLFFSEEKSSYISILFILSLPASSWTSTYQLILFDNSICSLISGSISFCLFLSDPKLKNVCMYVCVCIHIDSTSSNLLSPFCCQPIISLSLANFLKETSTFTDSLTHLPAMLHIASNTKNFPSSSRSSVYSHVHSSLHSLTLTQSL